MVKISIGGLLFLIVVAYCIVQDQKAKKRRLARALLELMNAESKHERRIKRGEVEPNGGMVLTEEDFSAWETMWARATGEERLRVSQAVWYSSTPPHTVRMYIEREKAGLPLSHF